MLILITGGAWQGKSAFARTLAGEREIELNRESERGCVRALKERFDAEPDGRTDVEPDGKSGADFVIIEDVHLLVREALKLGRDPYGEITGRIRPHANVILTVNELGCGIVPMEAFDRNWRETTGRICCELARRADEVYRVTCGIPTRIK